MFNVKDKNILVLGGTGSIGSVVVEKIIKLGPSEVRVFARDESKHQYLYDSLGRPKIFKSIIGDVRDKERLRSIMSGVDYVINAAAMKSVPYCEENSVEAIKTNIIGTQNIIDVALENNVEKVICISTDKAAESTCAYGATKFLSERLLIAANHQTGKRRTIFAAVRLGNVLGARNSVLPVIRNQILNGFPITVSDCNMTRFVMSANEAVKLILDALSISKGGEIFMHKMYAVNIWDLIDVYVENICKKHNLVLDNINRVRIPPRLGEKLYEKLFSEYEEQFVYEMKDLLVVLPNVPFVETNVGFLKISSVDKYNSMTAQKLTKNQIYQLLEKEDLIY